MSKSGGGSAPPLSKVGGQLPRPPAPLLLHHWIKRSRVRFPHWNFFFSLLFFFCLISPPFFFLHARSAISMIKHFSSIRLACIPVEIPQLVFATCIGPVRALSLWLPSTPNLPKTSYFMIRLVVQKR